MTSEEQVLTRRRLLGRVFGAGVVVLIGSEPDGTERLLLVPADDPAAEWQCWFFAHWHPGEVRHPTFRAFIESEILSNPTVGSPKISAD